MKKLLFIPLFALWLQGCSLSSVPVSSFSKSERSKIDSVMLLPVKFEDDAYLIPEGYETDISETTETAMDIGGMFLPGIADAVVGGVEVQYEKRKFRENNAPYFEPIKKNVPKDFGDMINESLTMTLDQNDFFSGKVKDKSAYMFEVQVAAYGLEYHSKRQGRAVMSFRITYVLNFYENSTDDRKFFYLFTGQSDDVYTMRQFARKPELMRETADQALDHVEDQLNIFFDKKLD